jgi:hypothetical protein
MEASSAGKCMGAKEGESSTGCVWAAGFHHVMIRSRLARMFELMNRLFLIFSSFWGGLGTPQIWNQQRQWHTSTCKMVNLVFM